MNKRSRLRQRMLSSARGWLLTSLLWWAIGFGVAFGTSADGFIGTDTFFLGNLPNANGEWSMAAPGSTAGISTYTLYPYILY